jgi:hypothetical protein
MRGDIKMDGNKEHKTKELTGRIQTSEGRFLELTTEVRRGSTLLVLLVVFVIALFLYFVLSYTVFKPETDNGASEVEKTVKTSGETEEDFIIKIKNAIEKGSNLNAKDNRNGRTLLHLAAKKGYAKAAKLLLDNNADINVRDVMEATPLHVAVIEDKIEIVRILIAHGADLDATSKYLSTPLSNAADSGQVAIVKLLLENGSDVNAKGKDWSTPLKGALTVLEYEHLMKANNTTPEKQREVIKILQAYGGKE